MKNLNSPQYFAILNLIILFFLVFSSCNDNVIQFYPNGNVKIEGDTIDGIYNQYYENGLIKIHGFYKDGKKDSTWIKYYPDGKIHGIQQFKNDLEHGIFTAYDETGNLIVKSLFINGKLDSIIEAP